LNQIRDPDGHGRIPGGLELGKTHPGVKEILVPLAKVKHIKARRVCKRARDFILNFYPNERGTPYKNKEQ